MKKSLILILLIFTSCGEGNTARTRCAGDAKSNNSTVTETDSCLKVLPIYYGSNNTDPRDQGNYNRLLISCLLYNVEMWKCEKKSNILPP